MSPVRLIWSLFLYALSPWLVVRLYWRSLRLPDYRMRIKERFGFIEPLPAPSIWFHTVSVGEAQAAFPLIEAVMKACPEYPLLVTTTTPTGAQRVEALLGGRVDHRYIPYDMPDAVARFLDRARPAIALIFETEIWPNLFAACGNRKIPLLMLNARLSDRSRRAYARFPGLIRPALAWVSAVAAQSQGDADNLESVGVPAQRLSITGSVKFDLKVSASIYEMGTDLRQQLGVDRPVWIAASTHVGEEQMLLEIHARLQGSLKQPLLVLVPRHPDRFAEVAALVQRHKMRFAQRSRNEQVQSDTEVYLADTMGELMMMYAACDVAFVAGSLVPVGGHNMLEPASLGLPVLFGGYTHNFREIAGSLERAGAARRVTRENLAAELEALLSDGDHRDQMGQKGQQFVRQNGGALKAQLTLIRSFL